MELLTRSKHTLTQTHNKWSERQKARMKILFKLYPKLKEVYDIVNKLLESAKYSVNQQFSHGLLPMSRNSC